MIPLVLVYFSEYEINQGVFPTLLFPLEETPFKSYRDIYPTYMGIYQGTITLFLNLYANYFSWSFYCSILSLIYSNQKYLQTSHSTILKFIVAYYAGVGIVPPKYLRTLWNNIL